MKKNMKKLYSLLLVLALTVSMAAGCGKTEKSTTNSDTKKEEEVKKEEETLHEKDNKTNCNRSRSFCGSHLWAVITCSDKGK